MSTRTLKLVGVAGGVFVGAALPFWISSFWLTVATEVCVFAVLGISYNLLLGRLGVFSFGHHLFFGTSAYLVAILTTRSGLGLALAALLAIAGAALAALFVGVVAARARGHYFGMMTLAFAQVGFTLAATDVGGISGGENGLPVEGIPELLNVNVRQDVFYWLACGVLILALVLTAVMYRSAAGRIWTAIRENETCAASLGVDVRLHRLLAFTLSGALAGVAGVLLALADQTVTPASISLAITVQALIVTVIGGTGTLVGPLLGAIVVRGSQPLLADLAGLSFVQQLPDVVGRAVQSQLFVLGLAYIGFVLFLPGGLGGLARDRMRRWRRRSAARQSPQPRLDLQPVNEDTPS